MFNLIFSSQNWSSGSISVSLDRMFEFTGDDITSQFQSSNGPQLDVLKKLPCLFCNEGVGSEIAKIGCINRESTNRNQINLEISSDDEVGNLTNEFLFQNKEYLNIEDFEFHRNHWAVKDKNIYRFLLKSARSRRPRPTVFRIPAREAIEPNLASAMMPFHPSFDDVFNSISEAAQSAGMTCKRADMIWEHPEVINDVVSLIDRSQIVVCDCTGSNPNVFYEAGIAHTLGRNVIFITQSGNDVPFDVRHHRYLSYENNSQGRTELTAALRQRMQSLLND